MNTVFTISILVITALLISSPALANAQLKPITPADNNAKEEILGKIGNATEDHYSRIQMLNISEFNETGNVQVIINKSGTTVPPPPPPPPTCPTGYHLENGVCVKDVVTTSYYNLVFTADVDNTSGGTSLYNTIKSKNPSMTFIMGDLGYDSTLSWFKSTYGTLKSKFLDSTGKMRCLVGNHESDNEDGTASIQTETIKFCGNWWRQTLGNTVVFGFNSNGNLDLTGSQYLGIVKSLTNSTYMAKIKNVILASHKPCDTHPNSHHPVESKVRDFCNAIKTKIPATVNVISVAAGHNHDMAQRADGKAFISGAGGRSHYDCGTDSNWNWCNNSVYGYLNLKIDRTTGQIVSHFYNTAGSQIH